MYMDLRTAVLSRLYILRLRPPQLHSITPINRKDNSMRAGIIMSEMGPGCVRTLTFLSV